MTYVEDMPEDFGEHLRKQEVCSEISEQAKQMNMDAKESVYFADELTKRCWRLYTVKRKSFIKVYFIKDLRLVDGVVVPKGTVAGLRYNEHTYTFNGRTCAFDIHYQRDGKSFIYCTLMTINLTAKETLPFLRVHPGETL